MDKTRMGKRVASLLLSLVMMLSLLPTAAYAAMGYADDTQGAIVSENGTDVSDDSNSSGGTGDLQVGDSKDSGDTGDQQVGGSSVSGTAGDTTGAEGGADPTDSANENDSADPQDDGDAVMPVASSVVSTSEELVAAIAAANDGDTITLGEGEFTTYGNTSPKKSLTFVGAGTGTVWTIGNLSKVVAVDKSSTFLTILLALIFFREPFHWLTGLGIAVMIAGTALMLEKGDAKKGERGWLFYAAGSAVFAALQSILGKVGVQDMDSTLATALRTMVVLIFAWAIVLGKKEGGDWKKMTRRDAVLLVLSGITTGASWLCYYRALQLGRASQVVSIDKLSVVITLVLAFVFLHEPFTAKSMVGCALVAAGTLFMVL